jgi:hypothetical protein
MRFGSRGQTGLLSALVLATCLCRSFATRASRASSTGTRDTGQAPATLFTDQSSVIECLWVLQQRRVRG